MSKSTYFLNMMLILLLVVSLADGIFGQIKNICDASEDQKSRFIECLRREYKSFDYALTCSRYLNVRVMDDFVDLSCNKLHPSSDEKAKYSDCLTTNIDVKNAVSEFQLHEILKKCTDIAVSK